MKMMDIKVDGDRATLTGRYLTKCQTPCERHKKKPGLQIAGRALILL